MNINTHNPEWFMASHKGTTVSITTIAKQFGITRQAVSYLNRSVKS